VLVDCRKLSGGCREVVGCCRESRDPCREPPGDRDKASAECREAWPIRDIGSELCLEVPECRDKPLLRRAQAGAENAATVRDVVKSGEFETKKTNFATRSGRSVAKHREAEPRGRLDAGTGSEWPRRLQPGDPAVGQDASKRSPWSLEPCAIA
jgi:hypothetical protein